METELEALDRVHASRARLVARWFVRIVPAVCLAIYGGVVFESWMFRLPSSAEVRSDALMTGVLLHACPEAADRNVDGLTAADMAELRRTVHSGLRGGGPRGAAPQLDGAVTLDPPGNVSADWRFRGSLRCRAGSVPLDLAYTRSGGGALVIADAGVSGTARG